MPRNYVQGYVTNPGGSIVYRDVPIGSSTSYGRPNPDNALTYDEDPTTITFTNFPLTIVDTGGVNGGQGSRLLYTFPRGVLQILGVNVALTLAGETVKLADNAAIVGAIGSAAAATDNATLVGAGEATYVASTTCTLSSLTGAFTAMNATAAAAAPIDGRTTAPAVYLNFAVPDAGITANAVLTINGTIKFSWVVT